MNVDLLVISNVILWVLVIILAFIIYALARQIGVLYERVAPAGALAINSVLKVGDPAPRIPVLSLTGESLEIGVESATGRSRLLFFLSPDCPICKVLIPAMKSSAKAENNWLDVVLCSDGAEQDHAAYVKEYRLAGFPYVVSELLGISYGVAKLPYAILIDEKGNIASMGIVNSKEHLESLFEAKERNVSSIQEYMQKRA